MLMLTEENPDLQQVNARAAFVVADGAPLVWAARRWPVRLPERVAGSDLILLPSRSSLEWALRLIMEPRRLFSRYAHSGRFLLRQIPHDMSQDSTRPEVLQPTPPANLSDSQRQPR